MATGRTRREIIAATGLGIAHISGCVGTILDEEDSGCDREWIEPPESVDYISDGRLDLDFETPSQDPQEEVHLGNSADADLWRINVENVEGVDEFCLGVANRNDPDATSENNDVVDGEVLFNRRYEIPEEAVVQLRIRRAGFHYVAIKIPKSGTVFELQQHISTTAGYPSGNMYTDVVILEATEIKSRTIRPH